MTQSTRGSRDEARRHAGFTLMEVMIAVAIVGLLAAIALPAYNFAVTKGKRSEGRAAITDLMQQQERYLTQTGCYGYQSSGACTVFAAGATNVPFKTYSGTSLSSSAYTLGVRACVVTPTPSLQDCAEVFAQPRAPFDDPKANELWTRSTGEKGCSGSDTSVCWK